MTWLFVVLVVRLRIDPTQGLYRRHGEHFKFLFLSEIDLLDSPHCSKIDSYKQ